MAYYMQWVSYRKGCLYADSPPCKTRHTHAAHILQGGLCGCSGGGHPCNTSCLPLNYRGNPGGNPGVTRRIYLIGRDYTGCILQGKYWLAHVHIHVLVEHHFTLAASERFLRNADFCVCNPPCVCPPCETHCMRTRTAHLTGVGQVHVCTHTLPFPHRR